MEAEIERDQFDDDDEEIDDNEIDDYISKLE